MDYGGRALEILGRQVSALCALWTKHDDVKGRILIFEAGKCSLTSTERIKADENASAFLRAVARDVEGLSGTEHLACALFMDGIAMAFAFRPYSILKLWEGKPDVPVLPLSEFTRPESAPSKQWLEMLSTPKGREMYVTACRTACTALGQRRYETAHWTARRIQLDDMPSVLPLLLLNRYKPFCDAWTRADDTAPFLLSHKTLAATLGRLDESARAAYIQDSVAVFVASVRSSTWTTTAQDEKRLPPTLPLVLGEWLGCMQDTHAAPPEDWTRSLSNEAIGHLALLVQPLVLEHGMPVAVLVCHVHDKSRDPGVLVVDRVFSALPESATETTHVGVAAAQTLGRLLLEFGRDMKCTSVEASE